ncbi:MAG TPA: hypothetical protein VFU63_11510, partial [Ktedonobacterales bacterium]|nr:hypothetical protein [Ktedonobacterales bacterium]
MAKALGPGISLIGSGLLTRAIWQLQSQFQDAGGVYGIPRHATCQRQKPIGVSAGSAESGGAGVMTPAVIVSGAR